MLTGNVHTISCAALMLWKSFPMMMRHWWAYWVSHPMCLIQRMRRQRKEQDRILTSQSSRSQELGLKKSLCIFELLPLWQALMYLFCMVWGLQAGHGYIAIKAWIGTNLTRESPDISKSLTGRQSTAENQILTTVVSFEDASTASVFLTESYQYFPICVECLESGKKVMKKG